MSHFASSFFIRSALCVLVILDMKYSFSAGFLWSKSIFVSLIPFSIILFQALFNLGCQRISTRHRFIIAVRGLNVKPLLIMGRWPRYDLARQLVALSAHRVLCETPPVSVGIHFVVVVNS